MSDTVETTLQQRLKQRTLELNVTQQEVAKMAGVTQATISRYFRGLTPRMDKLGPLSRALGVTPSWLVGETEEEKTPPYNNCFIEASTKLFQNYFSQMSKKGQAALMIQVIDAYYEDVHKIKGGTYIRNDQDSDINNQQKEKNETK